MVTPYYADDSVTLYHGDCLEVLRELPDASVDSIVTDPPYGLEFMGKDWDSFGGRRAQGSRGGAGDRGILPGYGRGGTSEDRFAFRQKSSRAFGEWCEEWTAECLRVLKPGGHLLAFGGTRTWHRLACAVEDAGFEIRDSIAWLYGSGFPKSLDVSKAIDKAAGAKREVTGTRATGAGRTGYLSATDQAASGYRPFGRDFEPAAEVPITAPATPEAQQWQGWGTALKPAFEPVVVARKPLASPGVNVLSRVESELKARGLEGEIRWTTRPASDAGRPGLPTSSSSTEAHPMAATSAAHADASETQSGAKPTGRSSATPTAHGAKPTANTSAPTPDARQQNSAPKSSPPMATPAPAAGSERPTSSHSTTSTEAAPLTARRPGERSTTRSNASDSQTAIESFAGIATGLTGSWATVRIDRLADGTCVWPDGLPRNTAGGSTVASNVLEHGTGALNIDACRIDASGRPLIESKAEGSVSTFSDGLNGSRRAGSTDQGRWPANVILDESQAAALDQMSGESQSRIGKPRGANHGEGWGMTATGAEYDDLGGASRFFYVAKAPTSERPRVDGIAHPTVKPLDLMQWLVRLVTPPGGTVLEPFAGSGTTAEACVIEGFKCIAIEREADYLPLIIQRLAKPIQIGLDFGSAS